MQKKHIITIAGKLGSGKSSTAKMVAGLLGYEHLSAGDLMREMAKERGLSLIDLNKLAEQDLSIDKELDERNKDIGQKDNVVLDGRLAFYFIPESFKVFLEIDPNTASERIMKDKETNPNRLNESNGNFDTKEEIIESIKDRLLCERKRYRDLYNIEDLTDKSHFDLVIDTASMPLEEVSQKIIEEYNKWLNNY